MIRLRRAWIAGVALAGLLVLDGSVLLTSPGSTTGDGSADVSVSPSATPSASTAYASPTPAVSPAPTPVATPTPTRTPSATPTKTPTPSPSPTKKPKPVVRPPVNSLHVSNAFLARHHARRTTWDAILDHGTPLPAVTPSCTRSWQGSGKDSRLNWASATYLCLDSLSGRGYKPQGVAGSATAEDYTLDTFGTEAASARNLVLTSWYSEKKESGLFATNSGGSVTRLVAMDLNLRTYAKVELVRPGGRKGFVSIGSHGSGLVWAGQYLYSSSRGVLWMYNADDLIEVRGHYLLPAIARWTVHGDGGLSSISIDRSSSPSRLVGINYSKAGKAYIQSFALASNGLLAANGRSTSRDLRLKNTYGERGRVVHSVRSQVVTGSSFQGVASAGPYSFANSSALHTRGRVVDAMVVLKSGRIIDRFQMPRGNGESIYLDYLRGTFTSVTEHGAQFLYQLPLQHVTEEAER